MDFKEVTNKQIAHICPEGPCTCVPLLLEKLVVEARHWRNKELLKAVMAVFALAAMADGELQTMIDHAMHSALVNAELEADHETEGASRPGES